MDISEIERNDLLQITTETVEFFSKTRWAMNFQYQHIGERVRYGGEGQYEEFGSKHILAFQSGRGLWHTPNCSEKVIIIMRETYLASLQENENA